MKEFVAVQLAFVAMRVPVLTWARKPKPTSDAGQPPLGDVDSWREYLRAKMGGLPAKRRRRNLAQLAWWHDDAEFAGYRRPRNLRECVAEGLGTRLPCPWYSCRYHLGLDDGAADGRRMGHLLVKVRIDPEDIEDHETCAMAVANRAEEVGMQVSEVAELMGLSAGTIEAVERQAKWKISTVLGGVVKDWE